MKKTNMLLSGAGIILRTKQNLIDFINFFLLLKIPSRLQLSTFSMSASRLWRLSEKALQPKRDKHNRHSHIVASATRCRMSYNFRLRQRWTAYSRCTEC